MHEEKSWSTRESQRVFLIFLKLLNLQATVFEKIQFCLLLVLLSKKLGPIQLNCGTFFSYFYSQLERPKVMKTLIFSQLFSVIFASDYRNSIIIYSLQFGGF